MAVVMCVTGATVFIGSWIVNLLLDRGYAIRGNSDGVGTRCCSLPLSPIALPKISLSVQLLTLQYWYDWSSLRWHVAAIDSNHVLSDMLLARSQAGSKFFRCLVLGLKFTSSKLATISSQITCLLSLFDEKIGFTFSDPLLICLINHALMQEHPSLPDMSISIS
jgi:hypothetical protein